MKKKSWKKKGTYNHESFTLNVYNKDQWSYSGRKKHNRNKRRFSKHVLALINK